MKLGIYAIVLLVLATAAMAVGNPGIGNPDTECGDNGFDYGIAKYDYDNSSWEQGSRGSYFDLDVDVICGGEIDWTADPAVAGVVIKAGQNDQVLSGGTSGTAYCLNDPKTGTCQDISHLTFCGDYVCGDGILSAGEVCDAGSDNGFVCIPGCGSSCQYCSDVCTLETVYGGPCDPCADGSCNGVPEFSPITLGVAVAIAGLGLAYFRKN